jgi:hopanoid biosynthesis associated protein HpnK
MEPTRIIFNADDFGASSAFNRAVVKAHRQGVLDSASLIASGEAFAEAAAAAKECPRLSVGVHLVLCQGKSVLPPNQIPGLVDVNGFFPDNPVFAGFKYNLLPHLRGQILSELAAQIERCLNAGIRPTHIDGHLHVHMNPAVFQIASRLARKYDIGGIRLMREPAFAEGSGGFRPGLPRRGFAKLFGILSRMNTAAAAGLARPDASFGFLHSGKMNEDYVSGLIESLGPGDWEIYCHPTDGPHPVSGYEGPEELQMLLSEKVKATLARRGVERIRYENLSDN